MEKKEAIKDGLTCWYFFDNGEEVGEVKISFYQENAFIFSILSLKKGFGTKMIDYIKSLSHIKTISGDVSEGTDKFWLSVGAKIDDDEFLIVV